MDTKRIRDEIRNRLLSYETQKQMARDWRISPQYLSDLLKGRRKPGPKILKRLGLKMEAVPVQPERAKEQQNG